MSESRKEQSVEAQAMLLKGERAPEQRGKRGRQATVRLVGDDALAIHQVNAFSDFGSLLTLKAGETIEAILGGAAATDPDFHTSGRDIRKGRINRFASRGALTDTAAKVIVSTVPDGVERAIDGIMIFNRDSASINLSVYVKTAGLTSYILDTLPVASKSCVTITPLGININPISSVTSSAVIADNRIVRGDGGVRGIQDSTVTIDDAGAVTGITELTLPQTALHILDSDASHDLIVKNGANMTADRTLNLIMSDANRQVVLDNDVTILGTANSVLGRASGVAGSVAEIAATVSGDSLMLSAGTVGFGNFGALTTTDLAVDDEIPFSDTGSSGANKNTTVDRLLGFGPHVFDARLTLTSGTPVTSSDVTAAATIYLTPYNGNRVRVYDGTRWKIYALTEKSLALGTLASATIPNDIFLYDNAGTLTLEKLAWTNSTTRATALTTQDGVYVKSGDTTRLYIGSFYPTATTTTEDSVTKRRLFNAYNQVPRRLLKKGSAGSYAYTSTIRQVAGDATNQVDIMVGLAGGLLDLTATHTMTSSNATAVFPTHGIGEDSVAALSTDQIGGVIFWPAQNGYTSNPSRLIKPPAVGYHYYPWLEVGATGVTFTDNAGTGNGLLGMWSA